MSRQTVNLTHELHQYLLSVSVREPRLLRRLREETAALPEANMQISPEQGQFLQLLVGLTGATRIVEIGTFTGYSALCMALAMPENGEIICCDISEEWTAIARRYWDEAGVAGKISLHLGKAERTLKRLLREGRPADIVFIDADKENYALYYTLGLQLLRSGGLLLIDNTLWGGSVIDPSDDSTDTRAIREFNTMLFEDTDVDISMLPLGDGLTLARKR